MNRGTKIIFFQAESQEHSEMLEYIKWLPSDVKGKSFSHSLIFWNNQICLVSTQKKFKHTQHAIYVLNYVNIYIYAV